MLLANINEVIKASPAIQIQGKMTHLQRRAWNVLLANAYNELPDKDIHKTEQETVSVTQRIPYRTGSAKRERRSLGNLTPPTAGVREKHTSPSNH